MKKILIVNYYLVMIAWCLFLNDYDLLGILFVAGSSLMLYALKTKINYWRFLSICLLTYVIANSFLIDSSIPIYFPRLSYFLFVLSINNSLSCEYLSKLNKTSLSNILAVIIIGIMSSLVLVKLLPDSLYTIFTKDNLILMISFIFLPYFFSNITVLICRYIKECIPSYEFSKRVKI